VLRPTDDMLAHFDVLLVDLQDVGCRIYTFFTTLLYVARGGSQAQQDGVGCWIGPNPAGRPVEGLALTQGLGEFRGCGARSRCGTGSRWARTRYPLVSSWSISISRLIIASSQMRGLEAE